MKNEYTLSIIYEAHIYAEEKLHDEYFDYGDCLHGKEIIEILQSARNRVFEYRYTEDTTLSDMIQAVKEDLGVTQGDLALMPIRYSFLNNNKRFFIDDGEKRVCSAVKHLIHPDSNSVTLCLLLSCDAGAVATEYPLRFYFNSHESGSHNKPHVHVRDTQYRYNASVSLDDGEVIVGNLPRKLAKLAKKKVLSDQKFFYNCWNTMTDGLKVDINHHYKIIGY